MESNTHYHPTLDTSSSTATATSPAFEVVLRLGKKLVVELSSDKRRVDTLSRWMAHWIAELMDSAATASAEERPKRMEECSAAIMKLWAHRSVLPDGIRPFASFEQVFRALESLDPNAKTYRYFQPPTHPRESTIETQSAQWLAHAKSVDRSARSLVSRCLTKAGEVAIEGKEDWLTLSQLVVSEGDEDVHVITRLLKQLEPSDAEDLQTAIRSDIEDEMKRLDVLIELAQAARAELKGSIDDGVKPGS